MRHLANVEVGVATHTGRVRRANEDDFLLCAPQSTQEMEQVGWVLAIADGMGGAAGGAEASRAAVRAVVRPFLAATAPGASDARPQERMLEGFRTAAQEVFALSMENPTLRGMGTTLTVVNLLPGRMLLGHVGDTRCARVRNGDIAQLSEDHAVREPDNYLTRCIGAGQREVETDLGDHSVLSGDRLVLMTDGLWSVVPIDVIGSLVEGLSPQDAADELVALANENGGPDNSTVLVIHVVDTEPTRRLVEVDLPAEEVLQTDVMLSAEASLVPPRWPYVLLVMGLVLLAVGVAKVAWGIDVFELVTGRSGRG